jgi:hypothetical protein
MKFNLKTYLAMASAIRLAIWLGISAELFLVGAFVVFGGFGPCGPSNGFSGFVLMFHLPGIWLSERIMPDSGILFIPLALASGAVMFTILFWIVISFWRKLHRKNSAAGVEDSMPKS